MRKAFIKRATAACREQCRSEPDYAKRLKLNFSSFEKRKGAIEKSALVVFWVWLSLFLSNHFIVHLNQANVIPFSGIGFKIFWINRFYRPEISGEAFLRNVGKWGLFPLHFKSIYKILDCEYKNVDKENYWIKKSDP